MKTLLNIILMLSVTSFDGNAQTPISDRNKEPLKLRKIQLHEINPNYLSNGGFINLMSPKPVIPVCGMYLLIQPEVTLIDIAADIKAQQQIIASGYGYYHPSGVHTFTQKELIRLPQRNINAIAGIVAGVDSRNGQIPNIKGARAEGTAYFIDGVRMNALGTADIPELVVAR